MGKCGRRTDDDGAVLFHSHTFQFFDSVNADQGTSGKLAFPDLNEHVAAAGNDDGLGVFLQGTDRIPYIFCLV